MIRNYLFNGYRRISAEALFFLIPFGTGEFSFSRSFPTITTTHLQATQSTPGQKATTPTSTVKQGTSLLQNTRINGEGSGGGDDNLHHELGAVDQISLALSAQDFVCVT
jgi:hypothetical protein